MAPCAPLRLARARQCLQYSERSAIVHVQCFLVSIAPHCFPPRTYGLSTQHDT